jgi:hypothetical protein
MDVAPLSKLAEQLLDDGKIAVRSEPPGCGPRGDLPQPLAGTARIDGDKGRPMASTCNLKAASSSMRK